MNTADTDPIEVYRRKIDALELVAAVQHDWEVDRRAADDRRRAGVLEALEAGLSATEIGHAMGLSRQRVLQIKNG